jgi:hypothetical protein
MSMCRANLIKDTPKDHEGGKLFVKSGRRDVNDSIAAARAADFSFPLSKTVLILKIFLRTSASISLVNGLSYPAAPNREPAIAVIPIASAPQNVTRQAAGNTLAPPTLAEMAPSAARNTNEVMDSHRSN